MRFLMAMQRSTGKWFPRTEASAKTTADFTTELAAQFGIAAGDIDVTEQDLPLLVIERVRDELEKAGTYADAAVIASGGCVRFPFGDPAERTVYDRASVDRMTADRIRNLYGGADEEHKALRRVLKALWARDNSQWLNARAVGLTEKLEALHVLTAHHARQDEIDRIVAEGRALKFANGWR